MALVCKLAAEPGDLIVETGLMRRVANRTLAALPGGSLVAWSGPSGIGKTQTARWMLREIERQYAGDDDECFRALYYQVGEIRDSWGNAQKHGIRSLYAQLLRAPVPDGIFKGSTVEGLAELTVMAMKRRNVRLVLVDEAGCLSLGALRGMVQVRDWAEQMDWKSSIVFIGMDDLPMKLERLPQLRRRIEAWCYFEEYGLEETQQLLVALHPHFRALAPESRELADQVEYIHVHFGGLPGTIVPFLRQLDARLEELGSEITMAAIRATHELLKRDRDRALEDARRGYTRQAVPTSRSGNTKSAPSGERSDARAAGS